MWKNSRRTLHLPLPQQSKTQLPLLQSPQLKTQEKQNWLLDTLAFVACCVTGYTVLVML